MFICPQNMFSKRLVCMAMAHNDAVPLLAMLWSTSCRLCLVPAITVLLAFRQSMKWCHFLNMLHMLVPHLKGCNSGQLSSK